MPCDAQDAGREGFGIKSREGKPVASDSTGKRIPMARLRAGAVGMLLWFCTCFSTAGAQEKVPEGFLETLVRSLRAAESEHPEYSCTFVEEIDTLIPGSATRVKMRKRGDYTTDREGRRRFRVACEQVPEDGDPSRTIDEVSTFVIDDDLRLNLREKSLTLRSYAPVSGTRTEFESDALTFGPLFPRMRTCLGDAELRQSDYLERLKPVWGEATIRDVGADRYELLFHHEGAPFTRLVFAKETDLLFEAEAMPSGDSQIRVRFAATYRRLSSGEWAPESVECERVIDGRMTQRYRATVSGARPLDDRDRAGLRSGDNLFDTAPERTAFYEVGPGALTEVHYKMNGRWPAAVEVIRNRNAAGEVGALAGSPDGMMRRRLGFPVWMAVGASLVAAASVAVVVLRFLKGGRGSYREN